jgi:predicted nucleotidyltransferase
MSATMNAAPLLPLDAIGGLCRRYGVRHLDLFGSAATGTFDPQRSDFDFVADFADRTPTPEYADRVLGFAEALEALLGRKVDVLTESALRESRFAESIAATRRPIYDARRPIAA